MQIVIHRGDRDLDAARLSREVATHLTLGELVDQADTPDAIPELFHDALLLGWSLVRKAWGKPIRVNSGVRSAAKQAALRESGARAADVSPHVAVFEVRPSGLVVYRPCLALDLDTTSGAESKLLGQCIRDCVPEARILWSRYLPQTFVHFDVAPLLRFNPQAFFGPRERELPGAWLQPGIGDPVGA